MVKPRVRIFNWKMAFLRPSPARCCTSKASQTTLHSRIDSGKVTQKRQQQQKHAQKKAHLYHEREKLAFASRRVSRGRKPSNCATSKVLMSKTVSNSKGEGEGVACFIFPPRKTTNVARTQVENFAVAINICEIVLMCGASGKSFVSGSMLGRALKFKLGLLSCRVL